MPIYEFFCADCNTIFSFLSRSINTTTIPPCPSCKKDTLSKKVSLFATTSKKSGDSSAEGDDPFDGMNIDESRMEQAMASLASEAESVNEDDPRAAAQLMRKFSDMTGLKYQGTIEEALSRMEAGEDPDVIESELGSLMDDNENPFVIEGKKGSRKTAPKRDNTLYEM